MTSVYDFAAQRLDGREEQLADYRGQVLLVVNTASRCGLTPQYAGLEELQTRFGERNFKVLGFPCNQFANQEPGDADAVAQFCQRNYGVSFPMFAKVDVNGRKAHPLFAWLKDSCPGLLGSKAIKWNFTKFLCDRQGRAVRRFAPMATPSSTASTIEELL